MPGCEVLHKGSSAVDDAAYHLQVSTMQEDRRKDLLNDLANEWGIREPALLEELLRYEIKPDLIRALELSPLFFMAWADGDMDLGEDQFIHEHLRRLESPLSGASYRLICHWFNVPPAPEYFAAWQVYMRGKLANMDLAERESMQQELLRLVKKLAHSSGGFLGLGSKVSSAEQRLLKKLEKAFLEWPHGRNRSSVA